MTATLGTTNGRPVLDSLSTREGIAWARVAFRNTTAIQRAQRDGWKVQACALVRR